MALAPHAAADEPEGTFADAIAAGRPLLELRPRWNRIDETDKSERAEGGTLRATAGWQSAPWRELRFVLEGIGTAHFGPGDFNDTPSLPSPYPLLPDPRHTGLNRAFVDYTGLPATHVRAGRQVVRLDNQRWVSDNDFRQIPQLFDGIAVTHTGLANTEFYAAWFGRQRATSGDERSIDLTLLHAAWNPAPEHAVAAYAYFHDQAQNGAFTGFADNSYRVAGVRAEGLVRGLAPVEIAYIAEFARQSDFRGGDPRIDAAYRRLGAGIGGERWTLRYDDESKGSNGGLYGLQAPLTDFYAFNGWSLHFFNTPRAGLRDRWVTGRLQWRDFIVYGEEHRFRSDYGDLDYGRETDVGLTWAPPGSFVARLQHARYRTDASQTPPAAEQRVTKTWLTLTYTY